MGKEAHLFRLSGSTGSHGQVNLGRKIKVIGCRQNRGFCLSKDMVGVYGYIGSNDGNANLHVKPGQKRRKWKGAGICNTPCPFGENGLDGMWRYLFGC